MLTCNRYDFTRLNSWNDSSGLFTEENCDRLEKGDLDFTEQWYSDFADYVDDVLPQTATHFRKFLDGQGGEYHMSANFVKNDILGIPRLRRSTDRLINWYIRKHIDSLDPCETDMVGPDDYARQMGANYWQEPFGFVMGTDELDVAGSLGTFRVDVELTGEIHRLSRGTKTDASLQVHCVVLDIYDWHAGLLVVYEGNSISDEWAKNLADDGRAASFLVRGDYTYDVERTVSKPFWGIGSSPPNPWFYSSYIGSQFEITDYLGSPDRVDYAGNPMH